MTIAVVLFVVVVVAVEDVADVFPAVIIIKDSPIDPRSDQL